ncbi:MAG: hypothetical protein KF799_12755 [Bdellovibrionales bacterium]|nr:hypothetical protein [Bdellovibrionales bacterium]
MTTLFTFDQNLREVPTNTNAVEHKISELKTQATSEDMKERAKALSEMGFYLRILGRLTEAEEAVDEALLLILKHALGPRLEVQAHLRLAHVYQWQKRFNLSNRIFKEMALYCMTEPGLTDMLDHVWQHTGKNLFDQQMYVEALKAFNKALTLRQKRGAAAELLESSATAIQKTEAALNGGFIH